MNPIIKSKLEKNPVEFTGSFNDGVKRVLIHGENQTYEIETQEEIVIISDKLRDYLLESYDGPYYDLVSEILKDEVVYKTTISLLIYINVVLKKLEIRTSTVLGEGDREKTCADFLIEKYFGYESNSDIYFGGRLLEENPESFFEKMSKIKEFKTRKAALNFDDELGKWTINKFIPRIVKSFTRIVDPRNGNLNNRFSENDGETKFYDFDLDEYFIYIENNLKKIWEDNMFINGLYMCVTKNQTLNLNEDEITSLGIYTTYIQKINKGRIAKDYDEKLIDTYDIEENMGNPKILVLCANEKTVANEKWKTYLSKIIDVNLYVPFYTGFDLTDEKPYKIKGKINEIIHLYDGIKFDVIFIEFCSKSAIDTYTQNKLIDLLEDNGKIISPDYGGVHFFPKMKQNIVIDRSKTYAIYTNDI